MRTLIALGVVGLALAGCQTKPVSEMSYSELMETSRAIQARCEAQGAVHPSPEFEICIRQEVTREKAVRARNSADNEALGAALIAGSQSFGASMAATPRPVTCNRIGNSVTCF